MTRYFILTATFLALFMARPISIMAKEEAAKSIVMADNTGSDKPMKTSTDNPMKASAAHHDKSHSSAGKSHTPTMDETPHILRFHKERVKKIKKHHSKCWLLSMTLVVLCQLALLVIGYLHVTH